MRTDDFIRTLAEDSAPRPDMAARLRRALPVAMLVSGAVFAATMKLRPGVMEPEVMRAIATKLAVTVPLAGAGVLLARRAMQPERGKDSLLGLLALPLLVLMAILAGDIATNGFDRFAMRLFGHNYAACLLSIPLFSLPPLLGLIVAFKAGAPVHPGRAGVLAGLGAAGLGASLYTLHCPDDSPLFLMAWYSLATLAMAVLGGWAGRRFLRW